MAVDRILHIQIQPGRAKSIDMVSLYKAFLGIATDNPIVTGHRFRNGNDDGDYYNFDFDTPRPAALWDLIRAAVYEAPAFKESIYLSTMAICTGRHGWKDYLLIHHWDPSEDLDEVPAI